MAKPSLSTSYTTDFLSLSISVLNVMSLDLDLSESFGALIVIQCTDFVTSGNLTYLLSFPRSSGMLV